MAERERFCFICRDSLGVVADRFHDRHDTCGKRECEREVQDMWRERREDAHRQLDEDMGW